MIVVLTDFVELSLAFFHLVYLCVTFLRSRIIVFSIVKISSSVVAPYLSIRPTKIYIGSEGKALFQLQLRILMLRTTHAPNWHWLWLLNTVWHLHFSTVFLVYQALIKSSKQRSISFMHHCIVSRHSRPTLMIVRPLSTWHGSDVHLAPAQRIQRANGKDKVKWAHMWNCELSPKKAESFHCPTHADAALALGFNNGNSFCSASSESDFICSDNESQLHEKYYWSFHHIVFLYI
jgi:hypothetical protein